MNSLQLIIITTLLLGIFACSTYSLANEPELSKATTHVHKQLTDTVFDKDRTPLTDEHWRLANAEYHAQLKKDARKQLLVIGLVAAVVGILLNSHPKEDLKTPIKQTRMNLTVSAENNPAVELTWRKTF